MSEPLNTLTTIEPSNTTNTINKIVYCVARAGNKLFQSRATCVVCGTIHRRVPHSPKTEIAFPPRATQYTIFCPAPTFIEKVMQGSTQRDTTSTCGDFYFSALFLNRSRKLIFRCRRDKKKHY